MLVVDTSVAVKWVVPESGILESDTDAALSILSRGLLAPDCIVGEFANALFKKVRRAEIVAKQARQSVDIVTTLINFVPTPALVPAALELSLSLDHPVHDCIFLTAAVQLEAPLVTADRKFFDRCKSYQIDLPVFLLGNRDWP